MAEERLQKILARAGYGSRRAAEEIIAAGRVTVNGTVAQVGDKADASRDAIKVDGSRLAAAAATVYYAVYKPRGVLSTTGGPEPRQKVVDLIPGGGQLHLVGRLDKDSEGLMLLTNDGELTQRVSHPRYEQEKEYRVLVARHPDAEQLATWRRGVVLEDGTRTRPAEVRVEQLYGKGAWLRVIMHEGHKRQIREIAGQLGLPVVKLIRVRIANLYVGSLKPGEWRMLNEDEVRDLMAGEKPTSRKPKPARPAADKRPAKTAKRKAGPRPNAGKGKQGAHKPGIRLGRPRHSADSSERSSDSSRGERSSAPPRRNAPSRRSGHSPRGERSSAPPRRSASPRRSSDSPRGERNSAPPRRNAPSRRSGDSPRGERTTPSRRSASPRRSSDSPRGERSSAPSRRSSDSSRGERSSNPPRRSTTPSRRSSDSPRGERSSTPSRRSANPRRSSDSPRGERSSTPSRRSSDSPRRSGSRSSAPRAKPR